MNCCLWIILLLACRGNCGWGCGNDWRNDRCGSNWCGSGRNSDWGNECGCDTDYDSNTGCGCQNVRYDGDDDCDVCCDRDAFAGNRDDDCGCMHHMDDDCGCNENRRGYESYGRDDNRVGYETYGCQENGVPCPPPVPGSYMR